MNVAGGSQQPRQAHYEYGAQELQPIQWSQITPQYMPWGHTPTSPAAPLVTFTAQPQPMMAQMMGPQQPYAGPVEPALPSGSFSQCVIATHAKRKADFDMTTPAKQHITEEKMAAHMSRLHISSESVDVQPPNTQELPETQEKRLFMCEEMRRLQTESVLPSALLGRIERGLSVAAAGQDTRSCLDRLERPCMAVMLWQPPAKLAPLPQFRERRPSADAPSDVDDADNNNSLSVDLNSMDFDG